MHFEKGNRMNLLLIDDDFFVTTALKTILENDSELKVTGTGSSGKEAVLLYEMIDVFLDCLCEIGGHVFFCLTKQVFCRRYPICIRVL